MCGYKKISHNQCLDDFLNEVFHGLQENAIKKKRAEKKSSDEIRLRQEKVRKSIFMFFSSSPQWAQSSWVLKMHLSLCVFRAPIRVFESNTHATSKHTNFCTGLKYVYKFEDGNL
jgi:hypothetical protein